jgi:hypothetical protein
MGRAHKTGLGDSSGSRVVKLTFKDSSNLDGYDAWGRITWMRHYNEITEIDPSEIGGNNPAAYAPLHGAVGNLTGLPAR